MNNRKEDEDSYENEVQHLKKNHVFTWLLIKLLRGKKNFLKGKWDCRILQFSSGVHVLNE